MFGGKAKRKLEDVCSLRSDIASLRGELKDVRAVNDDLREQIQAIRNESVGLKGVCKAMVIRAERAAEDAKEKADLTKDWNKLDQTFRNDIAARMDRLEAALSKVQA